MTSGNRTDAPMVTETHDAVESLRGIADLFLVHDRPIAVRTDDSVACVSRGRPMLLRRARGYVPEPLRLPFRLPEPVLALGGQLKNTFCFAADDQATLGPHVGDLDDLATFESYTAMLERMTRLLRCKPRVVAHDLHPGYVTTQLAQSLDAALVPIQHHHAHVAAVMAEHRLSGQVVGVAFDGTGYGDDGDAWGGELLVASYERYERVATFRPLLLAGGERAIREPWRLAAAVLEDAYAGDAPFERLSLFADQPQLELVRQMLRQRTSTVAAHGVGRLFDAAAALLLGRAHASYEAQLAMALEREATGAPGAALPFGVITTTSPWQIDLRPTWRALVDGILHGQDRAELAASFHATIVSATAALVRMVLGARGVLPVVLSGGCFQNALLRDGVAAALADLEVFLPQNVPPGDGGLSLGQAVIAGARVASGALHTGGNTCV
jgi:hydrogenase maturation protein HypF